jgi:hypothetical protein
MADGHRISFKGVDIFNCAVLMVLAICSAEAAEAVTSPMVVAVGGAPVADGGYGGRRNPKFLSGGVSNRLYCDYLEKSQVKAVDCNSTHFPICYCFHLGHELKVLYQVSICFVPLTRRHSTSKHSYSYSLRND